MCGLSLDEQQLKREKLAYTIVCQEVGEIADCSEASIKDTAPQRHLPEILRFM